MTGGRVVVLGPTGRNFAAGMSGGIAYVLDADGTFATRCNLELVELEPLETEDVDDDPRAGRGASPARRARSWPGGVLDHWELHLPQFVKVMPRDYKRALADLARARRSRAAATASSRPSPKDGGGARWASCAASSSSTGAEPPSATRASASATTASSSARCRSPSCAQQGARCMECGVPFCHHGCPLGNLIPDWNDLVYRDNFAEAIRAAAPHEQLPRVHRPPLPGAVRGRLRARDRRGQRRHDQADRGRDRQPRVGRGLDRPAAAAHAHRPHRRRDRLGPGRPRLRAAAEPRRPHGHRARARRGGRRARPLRRPRLQDREVARRAARRSSSSTRASSSATASTSASTSTPASCASRTTRS